jgi:hypothetical protein
VPYLLAIVAVVVLTSPFGVAEGKAVSDEGGLVVEITVEVSKTFEAVLVRPFSSFEELPPTALVEVEIGTWSGLVTFPSATDWSLVFDGLEAGGEAFRSDTVTLTAIGVDPIVVQGEPAPPPGRSLDAATWWLVAGMLAALAALAALAWWTFAPDSPADEPTEPESRTQGSRPD